MKRGKDRKIVMSAETQAKRGVWAFVRENSLLLILGALLAMWWANKNYESYYAFTHHIILTNDWVGHLHHGHRELTVHFLINDILMSLFFAIAGKEVWEAVALKGGSLRGKKAATPLIATAGGMIGPIAVYIVMATFWGVLEEVGNGWAIPTATDIAFSYLVGRWVFGKDHPAVAFLLLLAIADDAAGLIILAVFYPQGEIQIGYMLLPVAAMIFNYFILNRGLKMLNFWPYLLIGGSISWLGFQFAGIHPALGLLPIIPTMPHAESDLGLFAREEKSLDDTLNAFEHRLGGVVEIVLFFFALANAGVVFASIGEATWLVLLGLLVGKPLGILFMGWLGEKAFGLPQGMRTIDLFVVGCVAGIGFTVALFVADVAFKGKALVMAAGKMGAVFSFAGVPISLVAGKICRVERINLP